MIKGVDWMAYFSKPKIYNMDDDELKALSMEKNKVGCATQAALFAQRVLLERQHHSGVGSRYRPTQRYLSDEAPFGSTGYDYLDKLD